MKEYDLFELSCECECASYMIAGIVAQLGERQIECLTDEANKQAFFAVEHYLERIAQDMMDINNILEIANIDINELNVRNAETTKKGKAKDEA